MGGNKPAKDPGENPGKGLSRLGAGLIAAGAVLLGVFSRGTWVTASYADSIAGGGSAQIRGAEWSTETTAVALLLFVAAIGAFALRRTGRRVVAAAASLAAIGAAVAPLSLLVNGADPQRVHALLTAGSDSAQTGGSATAIPEWATVTDAAVSPAGPVLAAIGCALALIGGVLVLARPGGDAPKLNKYEKESVRRERIEDDMAARPDSGRVMWDALDADIDPTDGAKGT